MSLIGRSDLIEHCVADLAEGRSVLIVGARGLGKTAVLDAIAHHLGDGTSPVTWISGADGASDVPLAPFAELLSRLSLAGVPPLELHSRVPRELVATQAKLVVDDADLLDASSLVLVEHVARAGVPVVVAVSDPDAVPRSIASAVERGLWVARNLDPLDTDALVSLAAEALGGEPSAESASALMVRANGSPRVLLELAAVASEGACATPGGVVLGPRLATRESEQSWLETRAGLDSAAVVAIERIAIADFLPLEAIDDLVLTALRKQGLVVVDQRVELATRVFHDAVLESLSPALAKRRCAEVADLLAQIDGVAHRVPIARLSVRAGRVLDLDTAVTAADQALRDGRPDCALEIVEGVDASASGDPHLSLIRGASLSALERLDEAEAALADAAGVDDEWTFRLCQELGLLHAVRRGRPAAAVEHVKVALAGVRDHELRAVIEGELVKWRLMAGEPGVAPELMTSAASADLQVGMALIQAMVASLDGPPAVAFEIVERGKRALAAAVRPTRHAHDLLALSEFLAQCFDGQVGAAEEAATARRQRALIEADSAVGLWEYASAELALHAGRLPAAEAFARRAAIHLTWRDFTGLRSPAVALHAATAARLGHAHVATKAIAALPEGAQGDVKVALHVARVESEWRRRAHDLPEAARLLAQAGTRAVAESHRHLAVLVLDEAWMVAPTQRIASQLEEHADSGLLADLLARRTAAYHGKDIDALLAAAEELTAAGVPGRVMHAEELAAILLDSEGHVRDARRIRAKHRATRSYGVVAAWPEGTGDVSLTAREREIATLAAARVRSKEAAARLGLSVRTVDNHLGSVFRKLGIQGRDELADALAATEG
jgi:DNA-binding CsgD family transcriptional regulator